MMKDYSILDSKLNIPVGLSVTERCKFIEEKLNHTETEDPLEDWIYYYEWLCKTNNQREIIRVMEQCTIKFRKDVKYIQDGRYLKLWIEYVCIFHTIHQKQLIHSIYRLKNVQIQ